MYDDVRYLKWSNGVLIFPCGDTVKITEEKIRKVFTLFKVSVEIDKMITTGELIPIKKSIVFQIKAHLI